MLRRSPWALLILSLVGFSTFAADAPFTNKNDDSCDVMLAPAATLLLPYFEVDPSTPLGETTLFTVANVTALSQIAHVTIWTDWSFPVLDFNIFLTGYDVQSINLYDVIVRGRIAEPGTSSDTDPGERSRPSDGNPLLDLTNCDRLAVAIPSSLLTDIRSALTEGRSTRCASPTKVGGTHVHAVGYVTIDVVARCSTSFPTDADYFPEVLLYDNVLSGDYQQVHSSQSFAQGGPMVHIRAFPEGGAPGATTTNLTRTFYGNYQNGGTADRRQPLPATFAARWIDGGATEFRTTYKIWREGAPRAHIGCAFSQNDALVITEIVRFDEEENPTAFSDCFDCGPIAPPRLPPSSRVETSDSNLFPPNPDGKIAGWMYLNLNSDLLAAAGGVPSQNWVVVSMAADGRYSVDLDAASLGNGCSPRVDVTGQDGEAPAIAPALSVNKTFASGSPSTLNNDDSCDIMVAPAATLLLPYFEVDLASAVGETTLFTVTNVTRRPQIAHVTLWTDWSFPVFSFDVFLTGYDVQSINLFDVIARGLIAPPGTSSNVDFGRRSEENDNNPLLDVAKCGAILAEIRQSLLAELQNALTLGRTIECANAGVGGAHTHAIGYATIDVVQSCDATLPTDSGYFTTKVLYDNVLIGDYQQVNSSQNFAQGNPMVHIRAIPEGGVPGAGTTKLARTFFSRLQNGGTSDRRQPLPSTFVARWISGGATGFDSSFKIWREGVTGANAGCAVSSNGRVDYIELVRFDEVENPSAFDSYFDPPGVYKTRLPSTVRLNARTGDDLPPIMDEETVAGWMYVNLDSAEASQSMASQSWVVVSMAAEGRYSVDFDALALGNGCSAAVLETDRDGGAPAIGPAGNP